MQFIRGRVHWKYSRFERRCKRPSVGIKLSRLWDLSYLDYVSCMMEPDHARSIFDRTIRVQLAAQWHLHREHDPLRLGLEDAKRRLHVRDGRELAYRMIPAFWSILTLCIYAFPSADSE